MHVADGRTLSSIGGSGSGRLQSDTWDLEGIGFLIDFLHGDGILRVIWLKTNIPIYLPVPLHAPYSSHSMWLVHIDRRMMEQLRR
jgi:hypothetical protein